MSTNPCSPLSLFRSVLQEDPQDLSMASSTGIVGIESALELKTKLPDHLSTIRLERMVAIGHAPNTQNVKRRATCPLISDSVDPEWVLKVVLEFRDTWPASRLHLNTGALRKEFFRQLLSGGALRKWDVEANAVGNTQGDFDEAIEGWIGRYIDDTALANQEAYMRLVKPKPYGLKVQECADRIEEIAAYMKLFPGGNGPDGADVYSEQDLKNILFSKMLPKWQEAFSVGTRKFRRQNTPLSHRSEVYRRRPNHLQAYHKRALRQVKSSKSGCGRAAAAVGRVILGGHQPVMIG